MSQPSPQSSAGNGPASSPFAGTNPTLYSPALVRNPQHGNIAEKHKELPQPPRYVPGAFIDELDESSANFFSRFQLVTRLPDGTAAGFNAEHELFTVQHQMKLYACFSKCVPTYSQGVYLRYDDLRDAAEGKQILEQHGFLIQYLTGYTYCIAKSQDTDFVNDFEGQIMLSIMIEANPEHAVWDFTKADYSFIQHAVHNVASAFGKVRDFAHVETDNTKMALFFRIEFHGVDAANRAVNSLIIDPVWGTNKEKSFHWATAVAAHWVGPHSALSPRRTKPRVDELGRYYNFRPAPIQDRKLWSMEDYQYYLLDRNNGVRRERILDGSDVRTTIMLRNIPNKMDWMALKAVLDEQCFGCYDFVYLRIDFKSGCNVGYAFINFANVHGMIALIDNLERRQWKGYRSTKAAEISYATIQGREALIQKFRNSSVMQETPFCRPRLFMTYMDAEVTGKLRSTGTEQAFPRPDNLSKLQRSMDSARTIGLFPPHGISSLAEQRPRGSAYGSAYDRGTPRDIIQAATQLARQRAATAPVKVVDIPDATKHDIEDWYAGLCGESRFGHIPFGFIPMRHVDVYLDQHQASPQDVSTNPGIIGAPAHGYDSSDAGVFSSPSRPSPLSASMHVNTRGKIVGPFKATW